MTDKKTIRGRVIFLAAVALIFIFLRAAMYSGLTVSHYTVTSDKVSRPHRFAVVTDLHSTFYGDDQTQLANKISSLSPEAVFLVGDIADDRRDFDGTAALLELIADKYPCYYVTGNHERWVSYTDDIKSLFEEHGVTVLEGNSISPGDNIVLHGIDDPNFYDSESEFLAELCDLSVFADSYNILLSHRPEYAEEYAALGFDLAISGHAHGGQIRLPFIPDGLYAPHQGFFPEYTGGCYTVDGMTLLVSRGLMRNELVRVFNPPEILAVTLAPLAPEEK